MTRSRALAAAIVLAAVAMTAGCVMGDPMPIDGRVSAFAVTSTGVPELVIDNSCGLVTGVGLGAGTEQGAIPSVVLGFHDAPATVFELDLAHLPEFATVVKGDVSSFSLGSPFFVQARVQGGILGSNLFLSTPPAGQALVRSGERPGDVDVVPVDDVQNRIEAVQCWTD